MSGRQRKDGFPCPKCGERMAVSDSRPDHAGIKRRRVCSSCDHRVWTTERVAHVPMRAAAWSVGDLVQAKSKKLNWRGEVIGILARGKHPLFCVESYHEKGNIKTFLSRELEGWTPRIPVEWTGPMIAALREERAKGGTYLDCADVIGVDALRVAEKCRELGIGGKRNLGRKSAREVIAGARG